MKEKELVIFFSIFSLFLNKTHRFIVIEIWLLNCISLQFKQISQAYEVLSNPEKKKIYDRGGEQALKEGGAGGGMFSSPMDIFDMFFGGGFSARSSRRHDHKGQDVIHQLSVSLEELYKGTVRKLALQKNVICDKCEGRHYLAIIT